MSIRGHLEPEAPHSCVNEISASWSASPLQRVLLSHLSKRATAPAPHAILSFFPAWSFVIAVITAWHPALGVMLLSFSVDTAPSAGASQVTG